VKEKIEKLTSRVEHQIDWRRGKVLELDSQGHTQSEIAQTLRVSVGTVNNDLSYLREQAKFNIGKYIDEKLPHEYEKCLVGLNAIVKEAWTTYQQTQDRREKIQALSLAKDCYAMKLELLTNATVVDDAIRFVASNASNSKHGHVHIQVSKLEAEACILDITGKDSDIQRPEEESMYRSADSTKDSVF